MARGPAGNGRLRSRALALRRMPDAPWIHHEKFFVDFTIG